MEYTFEDELEEIESRLYSEAYHSKNLDESDTSNLIIDKEQVDIQRRIRYFGYNNQEQCTSASNKNNFISLEAQNQLVTQPPVIQNNITVIPPRNIHLVPNNITVNQYTVPIIEVLPPLTDNEFLNSWIKTNQHIVNSKLHRKALRNKAAARRKKRIEKKKRQQEVICLLDDSDEECVIMSRIGENKDERISEDHDDDDIIFIPPPPQEVINIDDETVDTIEFNTIRDDTNNIKSTENVSQINDNQNKSIELSSTPESSNDFLENTNITRDLDNFNFGLHGLDFNNGSQSEFIKPDNPSQSNDFCETESSTTCSNDQRTEFNNSVKTIVFSEVEFPKGDIFAENNLETFGSLITPKRSRKSKNKASTSVEDDVIELYCSDDQISTLNIPNQCNKVLPNLSLMPSDQNCLSKININNRKEEINIKKKSKSCLPSNTEEQVSEDKIKKKKSKKKKKKSKEKLSGAVIENFQNDVSAQLESNNDTISKINEGKNYELVKSRQRKASLESVVSCHEVISTKRKKKCSESIFNSDNEKNSVKTKKQYLPNSNNVDNESSDSCEIILDPALEITITPEEVPKNPLELPDIIIIDEGMESSSDIEIIKDSNCGNVETIEDDLQLNCQQSKFFTVQQDIIDAATKFDVEMIQSTQSDNPEKWQILDSDKSRFIGSYSGPRCLRCKRSGHQARHCLEKPDVLKCSLCGELNHLEPRCPNKICRQCGNKGDYSTSYCKSCFKFRHSECHICNMKGHISKTCPDLWRRYHLTTDVGPLVQPERSLLKSRSQWWCSGCARKGHLEHECNYYNRMYPPITPFVISYTDVFKNQDSANMKTVNQKDVNSNKEIPSLLDVIVSKPTSTISTNIQTVSSDKMANTSFLQTSANTSKQSTICLQHNDGLPLPDYDILMEQTNSNNQGIICLQHAQGIPQPSYNSESENRAFNEVRSVEPEIVANNKNQDCRSVTNDITGNLHISIPNQVQTFSHVITHNDECKLEQNRAQNLLKTDSSIVDNTDRIDISKKMDSGKNIIMHKSSVDIKKFIQQELAYMDKNITEYTPRLLRDKFYKYDKFSNAKRVPTRIIKEKCFWFRALNMYIFGLHKFRGGNLHVNYLREYLANTKHSELNQSKRKSLFSSYSYIFGFDKHVNVSYPSILKLLIQKYDEGKLHKHL